MKKLIVAVVIWCVGAFALQAERVIFLERLEPELQNGIKAISNMLYNEHSLHRNLLKGTKTYLHKATLDYNDARHKVYLRSTNLTGKVNNNTYTCRSVVNEIKDSLFGEDKRASLKEFFPHVDRNDLRYFIKINATVLTYGFKDGHAGSVKEIMSYKHGVPKKASIMKSTNCTSNLLSEEVYFD